MGWRIYLKRLVSSIVVIVLAAFFGAAIGYFWGYFEWYDTRLAAMIGLSGRDEYVPYAIYGPDGRLDRVIPPVVKWEL